MKRSFLIGLPLLLLAGTSVAAQPPAAPSTSEIPSSSRSPGAEAGNASWGYDPSTSGDPGLVNGSVRRANDQSYGPRESMTTGPDGGPVSGNDIIDPSVVGEDGDWTQAIPDYHVVEKGDTLWDICAYYFRDPYFWPQVWAWNEQITNAHWIFPGDRVRLTDPYEIAPPEESDLDGYAPTYEARKPAGESYLLNRYAFIDAEEYEESMVISGGAEAKVMMSALDTAYIGYEESNPPIAGERLSVYRPQEEIYDIKMKGKRKQREKKGELLGYVVEVVGEVEVEKVAKKSAEATVADAVRPVERGMRVGELKTRFTRVDPVEGEVTDNGLIVKAMRNVSLNGEEQFVIINMGANRQIRRGNILDVVRKGDEYSPRHSFNIPYEEGHPRRVIGHILVLQVQPDAGFAVVLDSRRELVRGDHVEIRGPDMDESDEPRRENVGRHLEADGSVESGDGKAKAKAEFKLGN